MHATLGSEQNIWKSKRLKYHTFWYTVYVLVVGIQQKENSMFDIFLCLKTMIFVKIHDSVLSNIKCMRNNVVKVLTHSRA